MELNNPFETVITKDEQNEMKQILTSLKVAHVKSIHVHYEKASVISLNSLVKLTNQTALDTLSSTAPEAPLLSMFAKSLFNWVRQQGT